MQLYGKNYYNQNIQEFYDGEYSNAIFVENRLDITQNTNLKSY